MTTTDAREKVARGAALLDRERPGWAQQINLGLLDMSEPCACVLGQLEGSFHDGALRYIGRRTDWYAQAIEYGFERTFADYWQPSSTLSSESRNFYRLLQDAWVEQIAARVVPVEQPALVNA